MPAYRDDRCGRWRYRKRITLPNGKRVRIKGTPPINTKAAAETAEREHIERVCEAIRNPHAARAEEVPTLREFKEEFMATYVAANNKPSEQITKRYMFKHHLLPALAASGSMKSPRGTSSGSRRPS